MPVQILLTSADTESCPQQGISKPTTFCFFQMAFEKLVKLILILGRWNQGWLV